MLSVRPYNRSYFSLPSLGSLAHRTTNAVSHLSALLLKCCLISSLKTELSCCAVTFVMLWTSFSIAISLYIREFCNDIVDVLVARRSSGKLDTCLEALLRSALPLVTSLVVVRLPHEN